MRERFLVLLLVALILFGCWLIVHFNLGLPPM